MAQPSSYEKGSQPSDGNAPEDNSSDTGKEEPVPKDASSCQQSKQRVFIWKKMPNMKEGFSQLCRAFARTIKIVESQAEKVLQEFGEAKTAFSTELSQNSDNTRTSEATARQEKGNVDLQEEDSAGVCKERGRTISTPAEEKVLSKQDHIQVQRLRPAVAEPPVPLNQTLDRELAITTVPQRDEVPGDQDAVKTEATPLSIQPFRTCDTSAVRDIVISRDFISPMEDEKDVSEEQLSRLKTTRMPACKTRDYTLSLQQQQIQWTSVDLPHSGAVHAGATDSQEKESSCEAWTAMAVSQSGSVADRADQHQPDSKSRPEVVSVGVYAPVEEERRQQPPPVVSSWQHDSLLPDHPGQHPSQEQETILAVKLHFPVDAQRYFSNLGSLVLNSTTRLCISYHASRAVLEFWGRRSTVGQFLKICCTIAQTTSTSNVVGLHFIVTAAQARQFETCEDPFVTWALTQEDFLRPGDVSLVVHGTVTDVKSAVDDALSIVCRSCILQPDTIQEKLPCEPNLIGGNADVSDGRDVYSETQALCQGHSTITGDYRQSEFVPSSIDSTKSAQDSCSFAPQAGYYEYDRNYGFTTYLSENETDQFESSLAKSDRHCDMQISEANPAWERSVFLSSQPTATPYLQTLDGRGDLQTSMNSSVKYIGNQEEAVYMLQEPHTGFHQGLTQMAHPGVQEGFESFHDIRYSSEQDLTSKSSYTQPSCIERDIVKLTRTPEALNPRTQTWKQGPPQLRPDGAQTFVRDQCLSGQVGTVAAAPQQALRDPNLYREYSHESYQRYPYPQIPSSGHLTAYHGQMPGFHRQLLTYQEHLPAPPGQFASHRESSPVQPKKHPDLGQVNLHVNPLLNIGPSQETLSQHYTGPRGPPHGDFHGNLRQFPPSSGPGRINQNAQRFQPSISDNLLMRFHSTNPSVSGDVPPERFPMERIRTKDSPRRQTPRSPNVHRKSLLGPYPRVAGGGASYIPHPQRPLLRPRNPNYAFTPLTQQSTPMFLPMNQFSSHSQPQPRFPG